MDEIQPTTSTHVFIDLWNIVTYEKLLGFHVYRRDGRASEGGRLPLDQFPFSRLVDTIRSFTGTSDCEVAHAYCSVPRKPSGSNERFDYNVKLLALDDILRYQMRMNIEITMDTQRDIDALMINDLWKSALSNINEALVRKEKILRTLHVVIVSGDGIFLKAIQAMQKELVDFITLRTCVIAWDNRLSGAYRNAYEDGDIDELFYLEDVMAVTNSEDREVQAKTTAS